MFRKSSSVCLAKIKEEWAARKQPKPHRHAWTITGMDPETEKPVVACASCGAQP